jgi:lipoprotein-anchoring transpeptidase ErfK/SrfK
VPSSHGCVGMRYDDAKFFWDFATTGTRVVVHN